MVVQKRKKNSRQRGHTTHGYGSMKKHRGAGNRGGRGKAGSGKRADSKKPSTWHKKKYFGKHGFKKKNIKIVVEGINLKTIDDNLQNWISKKLVTQQEGTYTINLEKLGYNKLLSTGKITHKLKIHTPSASKKAIEKVQEAGGSIEKSA